MDVTPRVERPRVSPGHPPWVARPHADARALISRFLDDVADAIAPPPGLKMARRLDAPMGGEALLGYEGDEE